MIKTQVGEKAGPHWFFPYRKVNSPYPGLERWGSHELVGRPGGVGFSIKNVSDRLLNGEGVDLAPQQFALVAHPYETMAARTSIATAGVYLVLAEFVPCAWEGSFCVAVCVNGRNLWQQEIQGADSRANYIGYLQLPKMELD